MTIRQLTPPESEPVTLEQAKGFVRRSAVPGRSEILGMLYCHYFNPCTSMFMSLSA